MSTVMPFYCSHFYVQYKKTHKKTTIFLRAHLHFILYYCNGNVSITMMMLPCVVYMEILLPFANTHTHTNTSQSLLYSILYMSPDSPVPFFSSHWDVASFGSGCCLCRVAGAFELFLYSHCSTHVFPQMFYQKAKSTIVYLVCWVRECGRRTWKKNRGE